MNRAPRRLASTAADLFANIHEQAKRVLGKAAGFYVVTSDPVRDRVRLAYLVLNGSVQTRSLYCTIGECDAIRERSTLINDAFSRRIADDLINSISVHMVRNGVVVGAFGALAQEARAYDARAASALAAIAELGALALENLQVVA